MATSHTTTQVPVRHMLRPRNTTTPAPKSRRPSVLAMTETDTRKRLVVVGGTGFLGKVWLAQTLHRYPNIGKIFLVVRSKKGVDSDTRLWREVIPSGPFDALRADMPGTAFEEFCREKIEEVDYKNAGQLRRFASEKGKIRSRRITGACRRHQDQIAVAVKRAREMALLPYVGS